MENSHQLWVGLKNKLTAFFNEFFYSQRKCFHPVLAVFLGKCLFSLENLDEEKKKISVTSVIAVADPLPSLDVHGILLVIDKGK